MKARFKVASFHSSAWEGMEPKDYQENVYTVAEGGSISAVGWRQPYRFEVVRIRPGAVELVIHPELVLHSAEQKRQVGTLVLEAGCTANLSTPTFDAWGHWAVTLEGIT